MKGPWTTEHTWTDTAGAVWHVDLEWWNIGGRLECVGVHLGGTIPYHPITATATRTLPIGRLVEEGRHQAYESALAEALLEGPDADSAALIVAASEVPTRREYRIFRAAVAYSRAWAGRDAAPVKAVMRDLGVKRPTAGKYVHLARSDEYGFLEPTTEGQANGLLTAKAHRLLNRLGDDWEAWEQAIDEREKGTTDGER